MGSIVMLEHHGREVAGGGKVPLSCQSVMGGRGCHRRQGSIVMLGHDGCGGGCHRRRGSIVMVGHNG